MPFCPLRSTTCTSGWNAGWIGVGKFNKGDSLVDWIALTPKRPHAGHVATLQQLRDGLDLLPDFHLLDGAGGALHLAAAGEFLFDFDAADGRRRLVVPLVGRLHGAVFIEQLANVGHSDPL